jgi:hypothetical protein
LNDHMCKSKITGEISAGGVTVNIVVWNISVNNLHLHYITGSDSIQSVLCLNKWIKIAYLRSGECSSWGSTTVHAFWCCAMQAVLPVPSLVEIIWFTIRRVQCHHIIMHSDFSCTSIDQCVGALSWYDIFVNCDWVVTWWQKYSTHLHTNNT